MDYRSVETDQHSLKRGMRCSIVFRLCSGCLALALLVGAGPANAQSIAVGSKKDTEGVILGEMATQWLTSHGFDTAHRAELGGTQFLWQALLKGEIDIYPE